MKLSNFLLATYLLSATNAFEKHSSSSNHNNKTLRRGLQNNGPSGNNGRPSCGTQNIPPRDLELRFNKVTFPEGYEEKGNEARFLPLTPYHYPICPNTANFLRDLEAISVIIPQDCDACDIPLEELIESIGGWPSHPTGGSGPVARDYWAELRELIDVREERLTGNSIAEDFLPHVPDIWKGYSGDDVAEAVHDEFPGTHHAKLIEQLLGEGAQVDREVLPSLSLLDFVRGPVALSDLNTWAMAEVAPHNFQVKWAAGRARPEEVIWWIHGKRRGELVNVHGVPNDIVDKVHDMDLNYATNFTAYSEGSPKHPSWPAMHSASSAASLWLGTVMFDLTDRQKCEVLAVDYAVAYARTVAGVHFPSDNLDGLNLGQEILARKLPLYLEAKYGADREKVRTKIDEVRFDWYDYASGELCKDFMDR